MLSDFCERLEALSPFLDRNKLYGLRGRRIAASPEVFTALRRLEPWESALERISTVVGYFNLFHRNGPHRSYPKSDPDGTIHDDYRFYSLVGKANCAELPMTALHLGQTRVNWNGNGREEDVTVHSEAWAQAARDDAWAVNDAASAMASTTHELKTRV